jgi:hypothetical protein
MSFMMGRAQEWLAQARGMGETGASKSPTAC